MGKTNGLQLNRVAWLTLIPVVLLVTAGMLAIYATEGQAGSARPEHTIRQGIYLIASLVAMACALAVPYQKLGRYAYILFVFMLLLLVLLALVRKLHLSPLYSVIPVVRGSARWIRLGTPTLYFQLQPSEFMKVAFILALARYLRFRENYRTWLGLMPPFLLTLIPMLLILMEPDLGTVLLMLPVLFTMLYMAGARLRHLVLVVVLSFLATPIAWQNMEGYQRSRVLVLVGQLAPARDKLLPKPAVAASAPSTDNAPAPLPEIDLAWYERMALAMLVPTFQQTQIRQKERAMAEAGLVDAEDLLEPPVIPTGSLLLFKGKFNSDPQQDLRTRKWIVAKLNDLHREQGYQLRHSKVALGSGGTAGRGLWEGTYVRYGFLPDRHNDFVYAVLGHQWGLVGCLAVLLMYLLIILGGMEVAIGTDDPFGRLLAVGVVALIAAQVLVNVGMTIGLMPITGMTLPFVSFGGSSLITNFIAVGLLINVSRHRQLLIAHRPFEFGNEVQEQPASLARWFETRR